MREVVLKVENLSKQYRLGEVGTGTISHDLNRWWHKVRGLEDPYSMVGDVNDRTIKNTTDYVWALKDITFEVEEGEVLGVIGKNGAGKSTLLKILSKVTGPTKGKILSKGRIASLLEVGTGFHPEMTGRENIFMNGTIMGMSRYEIKNKFDEIVSFAGVEKYIDTPVKRYSSGMMVRLAFSIAAHLEPDILIVDEVLAVGDAEFQKKSLGKMNDVSKNGRTIIFVSHDMSAVQGLCTRCLLMENGQITFRGTATETIQEYLSQNNTPEKSFIRSFEPHEKEVYIRTVYFSLKQEEDRLYGVFTADIVSFINNKISLDIRILDNKLTGVAFATLGGFDNKLIELSIGTSRVHCRIDFSDLAKGNYSLSIDLAVPTYRYLDRLEEFISFDFPGVRKERYRVLEQRWGYGCIELPLENL